KIDARSRCAKATCRRLGSVMVRSFSCKLPGRGRTTTGASSLLVKPWIPGRASDNESDVSPHRPGTAEKGKGGPTCARQIGQPLTSSLETQLILQHYAPEHGLTVDVIDGAQRGELAWPRLVPEHHRGVRAIAGVIFPRAGRGVVAPLAFEIPGLRRVGLHVVPVARGESGREVVLGHVQGPVPVFDGDLGGLPRCAIDRAG